MLFYLFFKCFVLTIGYKRQKLIIASNSNNNVTSNFLYNSQMLVDMNNLFFRYNEYCEYLINTYKNEEYRKRDYFKIHFNIDQRYILNLFCNFKRYVEEKRIITFSILCFKYLIANIYKDNFLSDLKNDTIENDFNFILNFFYYESCNCKNYNCEHFFENSTYIFALRLWFNNIKRLKINNWQNIIDYNIIKNILINNNNFVEKYYNLIFTTSNTYFLNSADVDYGNFVKLILELFINHITKYNVIYNLKHYKNNNSLIIKITVSNSILIESIKKYINYNRYINISLFCKIIFIMLNIVRYNMKANPMNFYNNLNDLFFYSTGKNINLNYKNFTEKYFKIEIVLYIFKTYITNNNDLQNESYPLELFHYITFSVFKIYCLALEFVKTMEYSSIEIKKIIKDYYTITDENYYNDIFLLITRYPVNYLMCLEYLSVFYKNNNDYTDLIYKKTVNYLVHEFLKNFYLLKTLSYNSITNLFNILNIYFDINNNLFCYLFNDKQTTENTLSIINYIFLQMESNEFLKVKHGYLYLIFYIHFLILYNRKNKKYSFIKENIFENYKYIIKNEIFDLLKNIQNIWIFVYNIEFEFFINFFIKNINLLICSEFSNIFKIYLQLIYTTHKEYKYSNTVYFNNENRIKIINSNINILKTLM